MRTTVTLDTDVEALIKQHMRRNGTSFKEALNHALRAGLSLPGNTKRRPFVLKTMNLGIRTDKLPSKVLSDMEGEDFFRKHRSRR